MATPNDYFCDFVNGDDATGDGSVGTPWKTFRGSLSNITRDVYHGDQINVRDTGTDAVDATEDITSSYGYPDFPSPLIIRGYTDAADDGGVGVLSGAATRTIISTNADHVICKDMRFTDSGAARLIKTDNYWDFVSCEFDNTTGDGVRIDDDCRLTDCYLHNIGGIGLSTGTRSGARACVFENGANDFTTAFNPSSSSWAYIIDSIFDIDGATNAISNSSTELRVANCSLYSNAGTGYGITGSSSARSVVFINNLVEGFSGVGGKGIRLLGNWQIREYGGNAAYNNTTNYDVTGDILLNWGDNESLSASPFTDAGADDFSPADTGNVWAGSFPTTYTGLSQANSRDKGALQHAAAGGGGSTRRSRIRLHN